MRIWFGLILNQITILLSENETTLKPVADRVDYAENRDNFQNRQIQAINQTLFRIPPQLFRRRIGNEDIASPLGIICRHGDRPF